MNLYRAVLPSLAGLLAVASVNCASTEPSGFPADSGNTDGGSPNHDGAAIADSVALPEDTGSPPGLDADARDSVLDGVTSNDTAANLDVSDDTAPTDTGRPRPPEPRIFSPAPPTLHRLTSDQYRATVQDLLGYGYDGPLEQDTSLHGFVSVAASALTISPLAAEQYEAAAWALATDLIGDTARRDAWLGCTPSPSEPSCLRTWATRFLRRAWRRPPTTAEVDQTTQLAERVGTDLRDPWQGVRAAIAFALQSPHFLFRVELAEPSAEHPGWNAYTDFEMASRLSYALWGTMPDNQLLDAAGRGELTELETLGTHVDRLLADPRADARLTGFFDEFIGLQRLDGVTKDAELYPEMTPTLRESMRREIAMLFEALALRGSGDFRQLLTTNMTFVDRELARVYGIPFTGDGVSQQELPSEDARGGILGRAAVLSLFSHATVNSPTFRGKFVRVSLLCQDISPPPAGTPISVPAPEEGVPTTLRDRLGMHLSNETCASCHSRMDPLGFPLENFGPIGEWRELDNGLPIDATGEVDGVFVDGAAALGAAVADHPDFGFCVTARLYRYGTGQLETLSELPLLEGLTTAFGEDSYSFPGLVRAIVTSDGFRYASAPIGARCEEDGETRGCSTSCGAGNEVCTDGYWSGCDASLPAVERCNGVDDDCDSEIDEALIESCDDATCGGGTRTCVAGEWGTCEGRAPQPEACNGLDDDCNGLVDDSVAVAPESVRYSTLVAAHPGCDGVAQFSGSECNAAIHRTCAARSCAASGFGPVRYTAGSAELVCLPATHAVVRDVPWGDLEAQHPPCNGVSEFLGPNCNAAINRWCRAQGLTTGFGPVERDASRAYVTCTPTAEVLNTTYTALSAFDGTCSRNGERIGSACNNAIDRFCADAGFASGFGPLENSEDVAVVACIPAL
jgi:hypothetical protein